MLKRVVVFDWPPFFGRVILFLGFRHSDGLLGFLQGMCVRSGVVFGALRKRVCSVVAIRDNCGLVAGVGSCVVGYCVVRLQRYIFAASVSSCAV